MLLRGSMSVCYMKDLPLGFYSTATLRQGEGGGFFLRCDKLKSTYNREGKNVPDCFGKDCSKIFCQYSIAQQSELLVYICI